MYYSFLNTRKHHYFNSHLNFALELPETEMLHCITLYMLCELMYTQVPVMELWKCIRHFCSMPSICKSSNVQHFILQLHIYLEKLNTYYSALHQGQPMFQGL